MKKKLSARRILAGLLCLVMALSIFDGTGLLRTEAYASGERVGSGGATLGVYDREADPDTMDTYTSALLSIQNGSRYAGRVWTDKTVFAYDASDTSKNTILLDMPTDGYDKAGVGFNADFAHVFSALASSQVVNEYPPSPVDLVIVFDMSGSMGQDTRYSIDQGYNTYQAHTDDASWPADGVIMADRIAHSRIQTTLNAINKTIDDLMANNPQNRVAVCGYGANAVVLMPLAHYKRVDTNNNGVSDERDDPYLTVGGMETLYHPSDLVYKDETDVGEGKAGWYWQNNRDTCYTVVVNAEKNEQTTPLEENQTWDNVDWTPVKLTVSNNVRNKDGESVKAFPGKWDEPGQPSDEFANASQEVYNGSLNGGEYGYARNEKLIAAIASTEQLEADDYVGYFTNTQGGIFLAYQQLAKTDATTYAEELTNGTLSKVARIPAAIIMSDGGANFAFNTMGGDAEHWYHRYGQTHSDVLTTTENDWYVKDDSVRQNDGIDTWENREIDYSHRLNGNVGDEWYNVFLPGSDTLAGDWNGLHGIYNSGADYYKDGTLSTQPYWDYAGVLYSNDRELGSIGGTVLEVLLTAAYMTDVVKEHYNNGWDRENVTKDSRVDLTTYTMNVDTAHVPQWGRWRLYPTLDPKGHPLDGIGDLSDRTAWNNNLKELGEIYGGNDWGDEGRTYAIDHTAFQTLKENWDNWKKGDTIAPGCGGLGGIKININSIPELDTDPDALTYTAGDDVIKVGRQEIIDNIAYNERFYDVTSGELGNIFSEILALILGKVFVPVSGSNDAGVGDSITYQDSIGDLMEVKNGSITATPWHTNGDLGAETSATTYDMAMLLFGEMHGLVRSAVYDYQWNDAYMEKYGTGKGNPFPEGWYKGDPRNTDGPTVDGPYTVLPPDCNNSEDAWAEGWVYRLGSATIGEFIPNMESVDPSDAGGRQQNTVFTVYRFNCNGEDRNKLRMNPIYGTEVPKEAQEAWDKYYRENNTYPSGNSLYAKYDGVYRLSDIRVWVEEYGDYKDEGIAAGQNYDSAVMVNIPSAAVPTQLAEITLGPAGVLSYETNLGSDHKADASDAEKYKAYLNYCYQSTPLRLFYAVGVDDSILETGDDGTTGTVDISSIPVDYLESHRGTKMNDQGQTESDNSRVWFISNYYSESDYEGYGTYKGQVTRGDPAVTFSPSVDNRYYVFQKPLPIYAHAYRVQPGGRLLAVDRNDGVMWNAESNRTGGNANTTWETYDSDGDGVSEQQTRAGWVGGEFVDTFEDEGDFSKNYNSSMDGKIVFLAGDRLDHIQSTADGSGYTEGSVAFNSDDFFFLLVEFYVPDTDTVGKDLNQDEIPGSYGGRMVQYAITRKGSEFGSAFGSDQINNGDMLCWTDMNGHILQIPYRSRTETGDDTRGEPTWETLYGDVEKDMRTYLQGVCPDHVNEAVAFWEGVRKDLTVQLESAAVVGDTITPDGKLDKDEFNALFHFAVAAKPGGLRTGDMAQNVRTKEKNVTETAGTYYVPTISGTSGTGDEIVINNYLGNNGRLWVYNTLLLVTKTVLSTDVMHTADDELFDFQVFIQGMNGRTVNAIVVQRDDYTGLWRRRIGTIDALTDNRNLLQNATGEALAIVDRTGAIWRDASQGAQYYVWTGGPDPDFGTDHTFNLYTAADKPESEANGSYVFYVSEEHYNSIPAAERGRYAVETPEHPEGDIVFKTDSTMYLIPVDALPGEKEWDGNTEPAPEVQAQAVHIASLPMATMRIDKDKGLRSGVRILSSFYIRTNYLTKSVTFGQVDDVPLTADGLFDKTIFQNPRQTKDQNGRVTFSSGKYGPENVPAGAEGGPVTSVVPATAQFQLKDGEGLLFTGMSNLASFRVTEKLRDDQLKAGYTLDGVKLVQNQNYIEYSLADELQELGPETEIGTRNPGYAKMEHYWVFEGGKNHVDIGTPTEVRKEGSDDLATPNNAAWFDKDGHYYSVYGDTSELEKAAHFYNTQPGKALTISKELQFADGMEPTDADWDVDFTFTADFSFPTPPGGPDVGEQWIFPVVKNDRYDKPYDEETIPLTAETAGGVYELGATDLPEDIAITGYMKVTGPEGPDGKYQAQFSSPNGETFTWNDSFTLKGGERIHIYGLPVNSGYTVHVDEAAQPGYTVDPDPRSGTLTVDPKSPDTVTALTFTNTKHPDPARVTLDVKKEFTGTRPEDKEIEQYFTFRLIPETKTEGDPVAEHGEYVVGDSVKLIEGKTIRILDNVEYTKAGVYYYLLREDIGSEYNVQYDTTVHRIKVTVAGPVTDNETKNSYMLAEISDVCDPPCGATITEDIPDIGEPHYDPASRSYLYGATFSSFKNSYDGGAVFVALEGRKNLVGGELRAGQFTFLLNPVGGSLDEDGPVTGDPGGDGPGMDDPGMGGDGPTIDEPSAGDPNAGDPNAGDPNENGPTVDETGGDETTDPGDSEPTPVEPGPGSEVDPGMGGPEIFASVSVGTETAAVWAGGDEAMPAAVEPGYETDAPQIDAPQAGAPQIDAAVDDVPQDSPTTDPGMTDPGWTDPGWTDPGTSDPIGDEPATDTPAPADTSVPEDTPAPTGDPTATADPSATAEPGMEGDPGWTEDPGIEDGPGEVSPEPSASPNIEMDQVVTIAYEWQPMPDGASGQVSATNDSSGRFRFGSIKFTQPGTYWYQLTEFVDPGSSIQPQGKSRSGYNIRVVVTKEDDGTLSAVVSCFYNDSPDDVFEHGTPATDLEYLLFTNIETKPKKTEPVPGPDEPVEVGDVITYRVTWYNNAQMEGEHTVTVKDRLDPGVTYVEGSAAAYTDEAPEKAPTESAEHRIPNAPAEGIAVEISYDAASHTLTWVITGTQPRDHGYVEFQVRVNEKAQYDWDYSNTDDPANGEDTPDGLPDVNKDVDDWVVHNQAAVRVDNEPWVWTDKIDNTVEAGELKVTKIVSGDAGDVTKTFTFTVTLTKPAGMSDQGWSDVWTSLVRGYVGLNGKVDGELTFTRQPDGSYVSEEFTLGHGQSVIIGGLPDGTGYTVTEKEAGQDDYTTTYTPSQTGTITAKKQGQSVVVSEVTANNSKGNTPPPEETPWNPPPPPGGTPTPTPDGTPSPTPEGTPSPTPEGTPSPTPVGTPGPTPSYPNPTPTPSGGPHKVETDPGDGRTVTVGQVITYHIYWENKRGVPASVTIRDPLDVGVDFFSADTGGVYDAANHTVWWYLGEQPAGARGYVTLRVTVNNNALMFGIVKNQAFVNDEPTEVPRNPLPNSPKTGDENQPGLWLAVMAAAMTGAGLAGTAARRRRKRSKH